MGRRARTRFSTLIGAAMLAAIVVGALAPAASAKTSGVVIDAAALRKVLNAQPLPTLQLLPVTATSHPFNGALWQNKPIKLASYGYVEREYLVSGNSNVYDWVAGTDYNTRILREGSYTTRIMVRQPAEMSTWSGRVVIELINSSAGYDWTAIWSALWEQTLAKHDVYIGLTAKPAVIPGMQLLDPERYADLAMDNPLPPEEQAGGTMPGDPDYNTDYSKLYENGLVWDIVTQTGRLLKSTSARNPLGRPAKLVVLSGESQQGNVLVTYYKWFTPATYLKSGKPIFDGYLAECLVNTDPQSQFPSRLSTPINQTAPITNPLPADDPQLGWVPARAVPWLSINSQWDYSAARGFAQPKNYNTKTHKARFWELAGCNHGWEWQYLYGDGCAADLIKMGFWDPASYAWHTTPNNPEVPLYMAEKAGYEALVTWIRGGAAPPVPQHILSKPNDPSIGYGALRDAPIYDGLGNAMGGLRLPMVAVPVASFGAGQYYLTGPDGSEIVPFEASILAQLYDSKADYLAKYKASAMQLVEQRYLLRSDALRLIDQAKGITSIP